MTSTRTPTALASTETVTPTPNPVPPRRPPGATPQPTIGPQRQFLVTPTPQPATPTPRPASDFERALAGALKMMALQLGVDGTELTIESAERVTWPDSCRDAYPPDFLRAHWPELPCLSEGPTSGYAILFSGPHGARHRVHTEDRGSPGWVPAESAFGQITEDGLQGGDLLDVRIDGGVDGKVRRFRLAPRAQISGPSGLPELAIPLAGAPVWIAFDPAPDGAPAILAAVIVTGPPE
ncbi:MAG: hypothetical protein O2895_05565 [Chloroflexi bacterium]|nr:hypothetical protein [Chloroflexota bacterium]